MPRNLKHQFMLLKIASERFGCGLLLALAALTATPASAQQQPLQPANFGAPQPAKKGWFQRLPWANKNAKKKTTTPTPLKKKNVSPEQQREGQFAMGRLAEKRDQAEAANAIFEALIQKDPKDHRPYHRLGVMAAKAGDPKRAEELLSHARQLNPNDVEVLRDLGYLYYKLGKLNEAEQCYKIGLQAEPKHQGIANNYAMLLAEAEMYEDALTLFKRANEPAEAHSNMGFMLAQMGHLDKASKYFSHALTLDKDLKSAAHGLIQVAELRERVEAMRIQEMKLAGNEAGPDADAAGAPVGAPVGAQASLSDEVAPASRISSESAPGKEQVRVVSRVERNTQAPPAKRLTPVRVGAPQTTSPAAPTSAKTTTTPATISRRQPVGVKPLTQEAPSQSLRVGPARTPNSNALKIRAVERPRSTLERQPGNESATPVAPVRVEPTTTGSRLPSGNFHWSTSRFPTSGPTWTPNAAKTETPDALVR